MADFFTKKFKLGHTSLRDLPKLRRFKRKRVSSYDRTGGNDDFLVIAPHEKRVIFDEDGPGCITHIWTTQSMLGDKVFPRNIIIRIWWDDEEEPSVECPLGDFFGVGHGNRINFVSLPLQMSPKKGKGMNCWFPMPFKKHAKIEIENDSPKGWNILGSPPKKKKCLIFYYYIDYELFDEWPYEEEEIGYFHAQFRIKDYAPDVKIDKDTGKKYSIMEWQVTGGKNRRDNGGYDQNHVILHTKGRGQYVGCNINIYNRFRFLYNWPGEGDDMIFIDDDIGNEPTLYGTGTEDYINCAYCPRKKYSAPYHGIIKGGAWNWHGQITYYRFHIEDPISFEKEIKVTIEHGHDNHRGDIWSTTAYWYQIEPHMKFPPFPNRKERKPKKSKLKRNLIIGLLCSLGSIIGIYLLIKNFLLK
ncbi:MAG: glycoside hydrolase family 172 protein [Promethearchaeota archaeon]